MHSFKEKEKNGAPRGAVKPRSALLRRHGLLDQLGYRGLFLPVFLDRYGDKPLHALANAPDLGHSVKVSSLASGESPSMQSACSEI